MEYFVLKLIPIFLVYLLYFSNQINCQCGETTATHSGNEIESVKKEENYLMVQNIFDKESKIKTGDVMECEVTKSIESSNNDIHVLTQLGKDHTDYFFTPIHKTTKCFSFQVRTNKSPHILLSISPMLIQDQRLQIVLQHEGKSILRHKVVNPVVSIPADGIVNDRELRGFWVRWLDNHFLEFGRDTDDYPILSYRVPEHIFVNFIGLLSYYTEAEWVVHAEPHCGQYNITEKTKVETKCKIAAPNSKATTNILQKSQEHILSQIKLQHEIFKLSKYKSKEVLLEYQQLAKKHFRKAEENQNKIYASDNEVYCPLKATTFIQITTEYFQFLEELQMELSEFKEATSQTSQWFQYCAEFIEMCFNKLVQCVIKNSNKDD